MADPVQDRRRAGSGASRSQWCSALFQGARVLIAGTARRTVEHRLVQARREHQARPTRESVAPAPCGGPRILTSWGALLADQGTRAAVGPSSAARIGAYRAARDRYLLGLYRFTGTTSPTRRSCRRPSPRAHGAWGDGCSRPRLCENGLRARGVIEAERGVQSLRSLKVREKGPQARIRPIASIILGIPMMLSTRFML